MPDDIIIGLNSIDLKGSVPKKGYVPIMKRPDTEIFTEDELTRLKAFSTWTLWLKYLQGERLITIWTAPDIINLTKGESSRMASRMRYQMDVIKSILRKRNFNIKE